MGKNTTNVPAAKSMVTYYTAEDFEKRADVVRKYLSQFRTREEKNAAYSAIGYSEKFLPMLQDDKQFREFARACCWLPVAQAMNEGRFDWDSIGHGNHEQE